MPSIPNDILRRDNIKLRHQYLSLLIKNTSFEPKYPAPLKFYYTLCGNPRNIVHRG